MNASKAKKEASEKKVFLNQKIAHVKPFLKVFSSPIRQVGHDVNSFIGPVFDFIVWMGKIQWCTRRAPRHHKQRKLSGIPRAWESE